MGTFWGKWSDFPEYIIEITKEIWEDRGVGKLNDYYSHDIVMRTPMGVSQGNKGVIASTMATIAEFPDRELFGQDVIWSDHPQHGHLSSHRVFTRASQSSEGQFGGPSDKRFAIHVIADCAARDGVIYDEWLVRDYGGLVRQLGHDPRSFAVSLIEAEKAAGEVKRPFSPRDDRDGGYHGTGNDNRWGHAAAQYLHDVMASNFDGALETCDRAMLGVFPGSFKAVGRAEVVGCWTRLRASFPEAEFQIHHQIGMDGDMMPPRAAIRWSIDATHSGWGWFGQPTGINIHIMGISHFEFGPWGLRREWSLFDEIAIWKQLLL